MANRINEACLLATNKIQYDCLDMPQFTSQTPEQRFASPYAVNDDGTVEFNLYCPGCSEVSIEIQDHGSYKLTADGGFFRGRVEYGSGPHRIAIYKDGVESWTPICQSVSSIIGK